MDVLPDDAPAPRLCHLIKWPEFDGYGFNLHAERSNPGQFIGKIDEESPAQMAGLKEGDRIVEVNGVNINNENHRQVVERIKSDPQETKLLVVDADTDSWYKEQDLVIKSSQLNVIYIKTPTPRPQPDSPRAKFHQTSASSSEQVSSDLQQQQQQQVSLSPSTTNASSLATSDFNEDSIEQSAAVAASAPAAATITTTTSASMGASTADTTSKEIKTRCSSPPMSPDSGKGEEELSSQHVVTIEAEINRQSPQHLLKSGQNQADEEQFRASPEDMKVCSISQARIAPQHAHQANQQLQDNARGSYAEEESKDVVGGGGSSQADDEELEEESNVEPDSLSQPGGSMSPSRPATASSQVSQKTSGCFNEARNGSADSGQSSSPDASSSNVSLTDSLENQTTSGHHQVVESSAGTIAVQQEPQKGDKLGGSTLDYDDAQTIKNYQEAAALANNKISTNNNNNNNDTTTATTPNATKQEATIVPGELEQAAVVVAKQPFARLPLTSNNNLETPSPDSDDRQRQQGDTIMKQLPLKNAVGNTNNNNYSGLNLNMTAAEMRELIARRKKFDPKKAQMNIRQKYEIIQQM